MGEMKIDIWLFFTQNPSMVGGWLINSIGIILSILQLKKNPIKYSLILFAFATFLFVSIGSILVFFGAFYSLLHQGYNQEIFNWSTDILSLMAQVALLYVLFSKETKKS
ncbi:MAG: hypothetical protein U0X74_00425 [Anaerolineales bacterium]